ncbi:MULTISPECIES: TetR/AcrR family transcriptional regulator [Actinomadura]|uniref:TetR/AcrR family transcriptional regulator n=1 Tax=Actinomadura yumaensis TaxID=111807 RepID=A0ABW2CTI0_9ACTN|nr:TetR/AcrR family transcriptional regulator [Actinomadura sp. J1-007]
MSDSRALLLEAASEEFARNGLKGTRVQAIVKRAGVNERMIYHHFGSKEGLYKAVVDALRLGIGESWIPALERAMRMEPYDGMRTALGGLFDALRDRPRLVSLLMHEWLSGDETSSLPDPAELPLPLRELYEAGREDGVFARDVPFEVAYGTVIGALVSLTIFAPRFARSMGGLADDRELLRDQVIGQLLDGMTGPR